MFVMIRVGLTGGIAAGKSTVSAHLRTLGATVIDYDELARLVVAPGSVGLHRIVEEFGPDAVSVDGTMNREWMAEHVFGPSAPADALERLDAIEHPLIYTEAARLDRETATRAIDDAMPHVIVHDVPLLAEVIDTIPFRFDHIVTVEAPIGVRIARMMTERGMSRAQAEGRIKHQSDESERRSIADIVIDSTQPLHSMLSQVEQLYADWTRCPHFLTTSGIFTNDSEDVS
ncbi:dephospho-CoA kinase [Bifidobacterium hapali]|nr:dephospho-CoA kinase [Bifidobacterium hapali]